MQGGESAGVLVGWVNVGGYMPAVSGMEVARKVCEGAMRLYK